MREKIITLGEGNRSRIEIKSSSKDEPATARLFLSIRNRSPPSNLNFQKKIRLEEKIWRANVPKEERTSIILIRYMKEMGITLFCLRMDRECRIYLKSISTV